MAGPLYKFYVDDSGTKEYAPPGKYSTTGGVTPYFVFAGLYLDENEAGILAQRSRLLKRRMLGTDKVEIKANWLRFRKKREERYLKPLGVTEQQLDAFVDQVYGLIEETKCTLLATLVVKEEVQARYPEPNYAPAIAYECLMQRIQMAMSALDARVHVTVDDMDGATPKGRQYRDNLERHHERLVRHGSQLQRGFVMDRLAGISFADSAADERLQLADLVAYAVYRQWVDNPSAWEDQAPVLPTYKYLGRLGPKFRNINGRIAGVGLVKFPMIKRRTWGLKKP